MDLITSYVCVGEIASAEQSHVFHIHFNGANYDCGFVCLRAHQYVRDEHFLTLASFQNTHTHSHHLNDVESAITRANFSPGHLFMADAWLSLQYKFTLHHVSSRLQITFETIISNLEKDWGTRVQKGRMEKAGESQRCRKPSAEYITQSSDMSTFK